jgi:hypothetical protein
MPQLTTPETIQALAGILLICIGLVIITVRIERPDISATVRELLREKMED